METSRQAQVLVPMATSLSFGLIFGTALVLILAPVGYLIIAKFSAFFVPARSPSHSHSKNDSPLTVSST